MVNLYAQQRRLIYDSANSRGISRHYAQPYVERFQEGDRILQKSFWRARVLNVFPNLTGQGIMHAAIQIGDSILMMGDENPGQTCKSAETLGASPISLFLYVPDADEAFKRAVAAGCAVDMPVADMFWGDRAGSIKDPFGHPWMIATHKRDLNKEAMRTEAQAFFAQMAKN